MDEMLFRVFAEAVGGYLDAAERTRSGDEARRLAAAWRALLELHHPEGVRGRCAGCRRRRGMCTVWRVAHAYFVRRS